jgi:hypothetical protein
MQMASQVPAKPQGTPVYRPRLGRRGRREIGRALEAFYEDVVQQGVPARLVELLDGLDAVAAGRPDSNPA